MKKIAVVIGIICVFGVANVGNTDGGSGTEKERAGTGDASTDAVRTPVNLEFNLGNINPLGPGVTTIEALLKRIINWLIVIAAPISAGMVVYGAYQMLFAAGEPEKVKTGRNTILYTVVGYAIILVGWGVVSIVENFLKGG